MPKTPKAIISAVGVGIMLCLLILIFPSIYTAGKDFGHTLYQTFSQEK